MRAHYCAVSEEPLVPLPIYGPRGEGKLGVQAHMRPTPVCAPHYGSHAKTSEATCRCHSECQADTGRRRALQPGRSPSLQYITQLAEDWELWEAVCDLQLHVWPKDDSQETGGT